MFKPLLLLALLPLSVGAVERTQYKIIGQCDGYPRVNLKTPPGICVGLVADGLKFPRTIAQLPNGDFVVVDMGGWTPKKGSVWLMKKVSGTQRYTRSLLIGSLDRPHGLAIGPEGDLYIGASSEIVSFPVDHPSLIKEVITGLPINGRHELKTILFDAQGALIVNVGSATDHCESPGNKKPKLDSNRMCPEAEGQKARGVVRRYERMGPNHEFDSNHWTVVARGLRNSVGLVYSERSGFLLQAENSRDAIAETNPRLHLDDEELPPDEINLVREDGLHYGWPYCYGNGKIDPAFPNHKGFCANKTERPAVLLPAHSAPLHLGYYESTGDRRLPDWYQGKLLVSYHGYRKYGHRLMVFPVDSNGVPNGGPRTLIWGWEKQGKQLVGSPVGFTVAKDGSIFMAEDKNGTILRISYDPSKGNGLPPSENPKDPPVNSQPDPDLEARCQALSTKTDVFSKIERGLIDKKCTSCHGGSDGHAGSLLLVKCDAVGNAKRILEKLGDRDPTAKACDPKSEFLQRLKAVPGYPVMPPTGGTDQATLDLVNHWIMNGAPIPGNAEAPCPGTH